jgi:hypothetical protein
VRSAEYLDVVQTADGSVWKGIVIEQKPNVSYKIATADGSVHVIKAADVVKVTKQRNKDYHAAAPAAPAATSAAATSAATSDHGPDLSDSAEPSDSSVLPPPTVTSGLRLSGAGLLVFPVGDDTAKISSTSFSGETRVGYEGLIGNFGIEGGVMGRFTDWRIPDDNADTFWTLETMGYGRAALHISCVAFHAGVALGLDTNYLYSAMLDKSKTTIGFGMNVQSGIDVSPIPMLAFHLGFDYHPGTDRLSDVAPGSVSYFALLVGAGLQI